MTEDEKIKQENEAMLDMFGTDGWRYFIERVDEITKAVENVRTIQSEKDLYVKQGELKNLDWIKSFPELVKMATDADI